MFVGRDRLRVQAGLASASTRRAAAIGWGGFIMGPCRRISALRRYRWSKPSRKRVAHVPRRGKIVSARQQTPIESIPVMEPSACCDYIDSRTGSSTIVLRLANRKEARVLAAL